jgi:Ca2+-binding EF-hand superfamily protein
MPRFLVALVVTVAGFSVPATAQTDTSTPVVSFDTSILVQADFASIDKDISGALSFDELSVLIPDLNQADFTALDTDQSGDISESELKAVAPDAM